MRERQGRRRFGISSQLVALLPIAALIATVSSNGVSFRRDPKPQPQRARRARDAYGSLPLSFEENRGQTDPQVKYLSRGAGYTLFLTSDEVVLKLRAARSRKKNIPAKYSVLRMQLQGANRNSIATGLGKLPGHSNYFIGKDPGRWHTNVPTFSAVRLEDIYPGIDLAYRGRRGRLEYDLVVAPRADPNAIAMKIDGADHLSIDANGDLIIGTPGGNVIQKAPLIYQRTHGIKRPIDGGYVLRGNRSIAFKVGAYDHDTTLVIDPLLTYASYLGGSGGDEGTAIAVDSTGAAWIAGDTNSVDFPVTSNAFQTTPFGTETNVFITKVSPDGTALQFSTYAGGSGFQEAEGIAVDPFDNVYVSGSTTSDDFPVTTGAFQTMKKGQSAFVTALDRNGGLIYSTFIDGTVQAGSSGGGIAVDSSGDAFVTGANTSHDFPTTPGAYQTMNCNGCVFVSELNPAGTALMYSTFIGGFTSAGTGIGIDSSNNAFIFGATNSAGFPGSSTSCAQPNPECAFIAKLDPSGSILVFSDVLKSISLNGIAVDANSNSHLVGFSTQSPELLLNVSPTGIVSQMSLSQNGELTSIALGPTGNLFITGQIPDSSLTTSPGAFQPGAGGGGDAFLTELDRNGIFTLYATYLGGSAADTGESVAVDSSGNAYVTGSTLSSDFPVTAGVFQPKYTGAGNANSFVARIVPFPTLSPTDTPTPLPTPTPPGSPAGATPTPPGPTATTTRTPLPSRVPTPGPSGTVTPTATIAPTPPPTPIPTIAMTSTPTPAPTATIALTATPAPTPTKTPVPTPVPVGPLKLPMGLNFHRVKVGKTSAPKLVNVMNPKKNRGSVTITGLALNSQLVGQPSAGFAIDNPKTTCAIGGVIERGKSCRVGITFAPPSIGTKHDSLVITGNVTNSGQPVALDGIGN